jgi:hypothetical protein
MNFETVSRETVILDPGNKMTRKAIASENRRDPLTGRTARICHFMALKWEKPDFNMNFFTGGPGDEFARVHLVFSPRTFFNQALGTSDIGALRNLYNETLCLALPEEINRTLKPDFQRQ